MPSALLPYLALILALALVRFGVNFLRRFTTARIGIYVEARLRGLLYDAYLRYPRAFFDRHATGEVISRATNDVYPVRYFIGWGVIQGIQSALMIVAAVTVLVVVNARLALISIAAMPAIARARVVLRAPPLPDLAPRAGAEGQPDGGDGRGRRRDRDGAGLRPRSRRAHALPSAGPRPSATRRCGRRRSRRTSCRACSSCRRSASRACSSSAAAT